MGDPLAENAIGKEVKTTRGASLGTVVDADGQCLVVELADSVARPHRERLGWMDTDEQRQDLRRVAVARITDEAVELRPEFSADQ